MAIAQLINSATRWVPAWTIYIVAIAYSVWLFYLGASNQLGIEPIKTLEEAYGLLGLQFLIAGLAVTPLRKYLRINLVKYRRALGVMTFYYILLHLLVWLVLDVQILSQIWADILKRKYVTIGMLGFLLMVPLALTSNNWSIRKIGPVAWRRLHKLTYVVAILGAVHFLWLTRGIQVEPLLYTGAIAILLLTRIDLKSIFGASKPKAV